MNRFLLIVFLIGFITLSSCNLPQPNAVLPTSEPTESIPDETNSTEAAEPTAEPTPETIRKKVVFLPNEGNAPVNEILKKFLPAFCADQYDYEEVTDIPEDADFVFYAQAPGNALEIAERMPDTHIVLFGDQSGQFEKLWTIQYDPNFLPFLAGTAASMIALDWRSMGLFPADSQTYGERLQEVFENGAQYFCGDCRAITPPYLNYPQVVSLPTGTGADQWIGQINEIQKNPVYSVFISEEAAQEAVFQRLIEMNVKMLGFFDPPLGLENNWAATINYDWNSTFHEIISRSESGEKGGLVPAKLSIKPGALSEDFSSGKAAVLEEIYQELLSGRLSPFDSVQEYQGGQ